jgi:sugar transferase EpsL
MRIVIKRVIDVCLSVVALCLFAPILAFLALAVYFTLGSPVFFKCLRAGHQGKPFFLIKFRTMSTACDARGVSLPDADRLTAFGCFLRRYSLDELPQFWNVLRGDMSIVGPRPLFVSYLDRYSVNQARRHNVKPGITGWAQVNGRNSLTWEERFRLDVWYVDHCSLALDLRIIAKTVTKVLRGRDIAQEGHATMPEFTGVKRFTV